MKMITWNVNGIRAARKGGFEDFIESEKPDILCLQETKVGASQLEEINMDLKGYQGHFSGAEKKGYSGVATYLHESLTDNALKVRTQLSSNLIDNEGRFVITEIKDLLLYNIYFPSGTTGEIRQEFKYNFLDQVLSHLKSLKKSIRERVIICGDFNICHKEIDIHHPKVAEKRQLSGFLPEERAWMDKLEAAGFIDAYRYVHGPKPDNYSWWSYRANSRDKNLGWRIDYFWTAKPLAKRIRDAKLYQTVRGSDHCPVSIELE